MTNNSDGLTPQLRPQLGIGWNRALPAPFGFDNCIQGDDVNDYLAIDTLNGVSCPPEMTIEFWMIPDTTTREGYFSLSFNGSINKTLSLGMANNATKFETYIDQNGVFNTSVILGFIAGQKNHIVYNVNFVTKVAILYCNNVVNAASVPWGVSYSYDSLYKIRLLYTVDGNINSPFAYCKSKIDEFRIYNKALSTSEIALNYNSSIGNNPCVTENLLAWFKFEQFENLDFSATQDGSDMRLGIRDFSGNNNHAQPFNMDTNPASPNYVLKPF